MFQRNFPKRGKFGVNSFNELNLTSIFIFCDKKFNVFFGRLNYNKRKIFYTYEFVKKIVYCLYHVGNTKKGTFYTTVRSDKYDINQFVQGCHGHSQ